MRPVVLTADPSRYPYLKHDSIDVRVVSTSEHDEVLAACELLSESDGLAGVTSSSEYFIGTATAVASAMGLPAGDAAAITRCRSKHHQRMVLSASGVPVPRFRIVSDVVQAVSAAADLGLPVVVKPSTGTGSAGVRLCHKLSEVDVFTRVLFDSAAATPVLVEEYVNGAEFSVEVFDDEVIGVVAKHLGPHPYFVELGHDFPAPLSGDVAAALGECALAALSALGVHWSATHTELRMSAAGPMVIEVNPRLAGGMIPALVQRARGIDLVDWVIAKAAGHPVSRRHSQESSAAIRFVQVQQEGVVRSVSGLAEAARSPGVDQAVITAAPGDQIRVTHSFRDRVGYVIATAEDAVRAGACAEEALAHLRVEVGGAGR
ncbi:ATP-grasp domain-containing protein [Kibdelosporangium persicum]